MTNKKVFGEFIKAKRKEKNFSQKELAEILFVTEGAISKWERGISYPDITLISDICNALEISEHEFITASSDTETRKIKADARKFGIIRTAWILFPTISYIIALITCFICNLSVDHTLSWFFIVLAALICAYTFIPSLTFFFREKKLLVFCVTTYPAICLLLFTCSVYIGNTSWVLTACIGTLMGYLIIFLPLILHTRFKFMISFALVFFLTVLLLLAVNIWYPFMLVPSLLITCYCFIPVILSAYICTFHFNGLIKAGICTFLCEIAYYFVGYVVNCLFGLSEKHYRFDFENWEQFLSGNVHFICFVSFSFISAAFIIAGILKIKNKKQKKLL